MNLNDILELKAYLADPRTSVCRLSTDFELPYNWCATLRVLFMSLGLDGVDRVSLCRLRLISRHDDTGACFAEREFYLMAVYGDATPPGKMGAAALRELELRLKRWFPRMKDDLPVRFAYHVRGTDASAHGSARGAADVQDGSPLLDHVYRRGVVLYQRRTLVRSSVA